MPGVRPPFRALQYGFLILVALLQIVRYNNNNKRINWVIGVSTHFLSSETIHEKKR